MTLIPQDGQSSNAFVDELATSDRSPIFNYCEGLPERVCQPDEVLFKEGSKSNLLYILIEGGVEARKEGVLLKTIAESGAIFGEISVLLDIPHMATITAKVPSRFYEVSDAAGFIDAHQELSVILAKGLAERLSDLSVDFSSSAKRLVKRLMAAQQPELSFPSSTTNSSPIVKETETEPSLKKSDDLQVQITERVRAEKKLQQQFIRINLLNQITRAISERQDLKSILRAVLRQLECNFPIDFGAVLLIHEENDCATIAATQLKPAVFEKPIELKESDVLLLGEAGLSGLVQGRTLYAKDTKRVSGRIFHFLATNGLNSAVAVPLMVAEKPFGVLLSARRDVDAFSRGEREFFRMLSDHVALAAHQARLYDQLHIAYDELRETQQAVMRQERLRALGEMASGIAHDINNTLSPIVVYSELITRSEPGLSETARRRLKTIQTAGEDIAHFVARLRDFYRKREQTDDLSLLNCNEIIEQVVDLTRPRWRDIPLAKGIVIDTCLKLEPGKLEIVGDGAELREALTNLFLNAVDAMPSGGQLIVRTKREIPTVRDAESLVVIEVTDTGIGMDEKTSRRCLEPFFSTKGQRGTGLGLPMVFGIVERHEGRIEIDSAPGRGTTMRLIFPARRRVLIKSETTETGGVAAPMRILHIDDEPLLRELMKQTLEMDGHTVITVGDGREGVEAFRAAERATQPFDVVITDLGMPHMDGRQVARILKKEFPRVPVILLTGWGAMMNADGDQGQNVDAVISKPPRVNELRTALNRLCPNPPGNSD